MERIVCLLTVFAVLFALHPADAHAQQQLRGDLNDDGTLDIFDVLLLRAHQSGTQPLSAMRLPLADLDRDGHVDRRDLEALLDLIGRGLTTGPLLARIVVELGPAQNTPLALLMEDPGKLDSSGKTGAEANEYVEVVRSRCVDCTGCEGDPGPIRRTIQVVFRIKQGAPPLYGLAAMNVRCTNCNTGSTEPAGGIAVFYSPQDTPGRLWKAGDMLTVTVVVELLKCARFGAFFDLKGSPVAIEGPDVLCVNDTVIFKTVDPTNIQHTDWNVAQGPGAGTFDHVGFGNPEFAAEKAGATTIEVKFYFLDGSSVAVTKEITIIEVVIQGPDVIGLDLVSDFEVATGAPLDAGAIKEYRWDRMLRGGGGIFISADNLPEVTFFAAHVGKILLRVTLTLQDDRTCTAEKEVTIISVKFVEDAAQKYGFDNYTKNQGAEEIFWKSVEKGKEDVVKAQITPADVASRIFFKSVDEGIAKVSPDQAQAPEQTLRIEGVARNTTRIQAHIDAMDGHVVGALKVATYELKSKTVAIILIHEDNDDVQATPLSGNGAPNAACVTAGVNGKRDTQEAAMDLVAGENILNGPDGVCNTRANNTDVESKDIALSAEEIEKDLNETYFNQAVFQWKVTRLPARTVNFDLNRNGRVDADEWESPELESIRAEAGAAQYDHNALLVDNHKRPITELGFTAEGGNRYLFVFVNEHATAGEAVNTLAHELGHAAWNLDHPEERTPPDDDKENLMHQSSSLPEGFRLRKPQWDLINPN